MKIYDESLYCQACGTEITVQDSLFNHNCCGECSFSIEETHSMQQTFNFHIKFIVSYGHNVVAMVPHYFSVMALDADSSVPLAWEHIRSEQETYLQHSATGACTSEFRMLLDRDGYRD